MDDLQIVLNQMKRERQGVTVKQPLNVKQAILALIVDALREPCFICNNKPDDVHIFHVPEGLDKAGQKAIFYSLCTDCRLDITTKGRVEYQFAMKLKDENERLGV
jgi:hypothetical protein